MKPEERMARLEVFMENAKENFVTRDRLEAEIMRARLEGYREGRDAGWKLAGLIFAGIAALAALLKFFS